MTCTVKAAVALLWIFVPQPPSLLGLLKEKVEGHRFHNNEEVEVAVREWLRMQERDLYHDRIFRLVPRYNSCISLLVGGLKNGDI